MGNRILKTGFLSIAAASVLTTSAFAEIETTIEPRTQQGTTALYLNKAGTTEEIFRIKIDNTDPVYSRLESMSVEINSTAPDLNFLNQILVYKGTQNEDNLVKAFKITDDNASSTDSISLDLDFTDIASDNDKVNFINTKEGNPTSFILVLDFGQISGIDDAELNVTLKSGIQYTARKKVGDTIEEQKDQLLDDTLVSSSATLPAVTDNFKIDTTNPSIVDAGFITSSTTTGKAVGVPNDGGSESYDYNKSFDVNISFTENLDRDYTGVLYLSYFNDTTKAFKFV
ncbi:MAG TPA: hypothetical protein EYO61_00995, partial [Campylobacterales bacterium]|nr:hypothetical protein [Campylobacterales bacterium]